jgi:hypothetical protein
LISGNSSSVTHGGILGKLVGSNVVDWENELDIVLFGLFNKSGDLLGSRSIKEGVANLDTCEFPGLDLRTVRTYLDILERLLEGERHTAADDERVDL